MKKRAVRKLTPTRREGKKKNKAAKPRAKARLLELIAADEFDEAIAFAKDHAD